ncbi:hypothetical protein EI165_00335 [Pseudoalteromonas nigrifaciens]|uniref:LPD38 domain-containing protein n=1 Tax=Pseudoalteromonas nigrifaciens TaxID=28109 RepID=UPI0017885755|nr:LPD38 domain-containing protein [Pseudoalteromonas nigrifaciens]MBE0418567.1 hypothetical protein [Pseudoalteromonas nigrifaciens]
MAKNYFANEPLPSFYIPTNQAPQPTANQQGRIGDVIDAGQAGLFSAFGGIFDFVGAEGIARSLYGKSDEQYAQMSDRGREALGKQFVDEDEAGNITLGEGATDLDTWLLTMANVAGQFAGTAVPGAGAAGLAGKAASLGAKGKQAANIASMGATGGAAATGQGMDQARQEVENMPDTILADSPLFADLYRGVHQANPQKSTEDKWKAAKKALANKVAQEVRTDPKVLIANFGASAIGDPIIGKALTGARLAKSGAVRSALAGFVTEGTTEAVQAGVQQLGINEALQPVDNRDSMKGVVAAGLNEGLAGGGFGAVAGGMGGLANRQPKQQEQIEQPEPTLTPSPEIDPVTEQVKASNPTLGEAMQSMDQHSTKVKNDVDNLDIPTAARQSGFDTPAGASQFGDFITSPSQESIQGMRNQTVADMVSDAMNHFGPTQDDRFSPIKFTHEGDLMPSGQPLGADLGPASPRPELLDTAVLDGELAPEQSLLPSSWQTRHRQNKEQFNEQTKQLESKDIIFGEDGRPQQRAAEQVKQAGKDSQNLLPQKDIIFAGNASGVNVARNGKPFKSQKEARNSKLARQAKRQGAVIEVVPFDNGYGWKVDAPATVTNDGTIPKSPETITETNTQPTANLAGDPINDEWTAFNEQSETKNIPRAEMPQIKAENRGAMVNFMKARDISHEQDEVSASSLKPTQQEFSPGKVKKAMEFEGGNRSILVSNDGYVLDGHHQWLAAREKGEPVKVIRLNAPIEQLVPLAKEMPSTETQDNNSKLTTANNDETAISSKLNTQNDTESAQISKLNESAAPIAAPKLAQAEAELPAVLKVSKKKWLQSQAKEQGLKKGSPGFDVAMAKIEEGYEPAIDRALAESSFETYKKFNDDTPESINRMAYNELRKEFGIDDAPPPIKEAVKPVKKTEPPKSGFSLPEKRDANGMAANEIEAIISKTSNDLATTSKEDWGNLRGQGKRVGGMVMGGMRDSSLQGEKAYTNVIGKLEQESKADYDDAIATFNDDNNGKIAYGKARSAGFDHDTSLRYGLSKVANIGMTFDELLNVESNKVGDNTTPKTKGGTSPAESNQAAVKQPASKPEQASPQESIDDFGEKLGGARKDAWSGFSEAIQDQQNTAELPLSKAWPEPNYKELAGNGASLEAIALMAAMRSEIPSKPRVARKVSRWAKTVNDLKEFAADLMSGDRDIATVMQSMRNHSSKLAAVVDAIPSIAKADIDTLKNVADYRISSGSFSVFGGKTYSPSKVFYFIERNGRPVYDGASETLSDVQALLTKVIKAEQADSSNVTSGKKSKISVYRDRYTKDVYLGWKGAGGVLKIKSFGDIVAAREYLKNNREEVEKTLQKMKETPSMRKPVNAERAGPERYAGNVTPETFSEAFGFRGVEFGNWVEQSKRQKDLNQAYDGLIDLAEALDLPPKALSLNGKLGLAFGARGKGGKNPAAAHYEPNSVVINLTKKAGSGSLAHEWWHALDNYFGKQRPNTNFITESPYRLSTDEIRPEMASAFKHVRNAIVQSGLPERSKQLDTRRSKAYWATTIEMTARSFETYIIDKLQQQGITNDYLANVLVDEAWAAAESMGFESDNTYPYPNKAEQEKINPAYQTLFDTIESENTSEGIRLFSKSKSPNSSKSISTEQAQSIADKFVKDLKGANGITVSILEDTATAEKLWRMSLDGATVKGAYSELSKTVYIIAENISDVTDLKQTLAHETIAHGGLDTVIGADAKQAFIDRIKATKGRKAFEKYWKDANNDYWDASLDVKAEEIFARFVENEPTKGELKYWWQALKRFIRAQLDKVGLAYSEDTELTAMREMLESIVKGFKAQRESMAGSEAEIAYSQSDKKFSRTANSDTRTAKEKLGLGEEIAESLADKAKGKAQKTVSTLKSSSFWQRLNEGIFDGLAGIKQAEEAAGITDVNKQGYVSARLASGLSDVLHGVFNYGAPKWKDGIVQRKEDTKGLLEVFGMLGDDLNEWLAWMGANRAENLKEQGRENNLTQADIDELKALANGKEQLFEEVRQEYNKVNSAIIDLAQEAGLLSDEQRAGFDEEFYVPFFRDMGETDPEMDDIKRMIIEPHTRKGIAGQSAQIKELKGGGQSTKNLLENIIARQSTMIDASLKNKAMMEVADNLAGTDYMQAESSDDIANLNQQELNKLHRVKVMRNGKAQAYVVSDPSLLRALIQVNDIGSRSLFNKLGRSAKRFLTAGITLSPDFIFKNFVRDAAHAWMINKDDFKFGTDSIKGLKKAFKEDESYRDLIFSGAAFQGGYIHGADPEAAAQQTRRALNSKGLSQKEADNYLDTIVNSGAELLEKYRNISDKVENANRLSTYESALNAGKSNRQAAYEAKDLMDYSLKGNFALIGTMIDMLPFFNARLQGMSKLVRAAKAGDGDRALKVLSANLAMKGIKVAGFSLALAAMNDDDERYQELPDWDKDMNWHFFAGGEHFRLPKPFELGIVFGTFPERMFHAGTGTQTGSDLGKAVANAVFNTLALNPIPQMALPAVEVMVNKSFFKDAPIEGMADENKQAQDRYNAYTSETAKAIGSAFNVSPKKVEHLIKGYTGTIGGYVLGASDIVSRQIMGIETAETPINRYPVIKAFYQGSGPKGSTKFANEFYDALEATNQAYGSYKRAMEEGDTSRQQEIIEGDGEKLRSRIALNRVQRETSKLGKQARAVNDNQNLTSKQKREQLDEIQRQKNALYHRAYVTFNLREW